MESFKEAIEIADVLVLGRDNLVTNQGRGMAGPSGEPADEF